MKNLLIIPIQTISDVITNSSSELFILSTPKSCEEVNTILESFTRGFRYPEVFSLKDYREWRKKLRNGEIEKKWEYPGTIFSIANGWFKDPEDEEDLLNLRVDFLFEPFTVIHSNTLSFRSYNPNYVEPIHTSFIKHINDNWDKVGYLINEVLDSFGKPSVTSVNWKLIREYNYWMSDSLESFAKEFIKNYDGPKPTVWEVSPGEDVTKLDGCILVVSEDDNSIPYEIWDKIRDLFNGWNIHLG